MPGRNFLKMVVDICRHIWQDGTTPTKEDIMASIELRNDFPGMNGKLSRVTIGDVVLWFSFETIVAFHAPGASRKISENVWGSTTGKHLNSISADKSERIAREDFLAQLERVTTALGTAVAGVTA